MQQNNQNDPGQKGNSSGFFLIVLAVIIGLVTLQNLSKTGGSNVSFRHQLEHLVNLDLVKKEENKLHAQNGDLVTFSGQFKDERSESAVNNYRYLELLNSKNLLLPQVAALELSLPQVKKEAIAASSLFFALTGSLSKKGIEVIHPMFDNNGASYSIVLNRADIENFKSQNTLANLASLGQVSEIATLLTKAPTDVEVLALSQDIRSLLAWFQSGRLGLSQEYSSQIADIKRDVNGWVDSDAPVDVKLRGYREGLEKLTALTAEIQSSQQDAALMGLLAVSNYKNKLLSYNGISNQVLALGEQLDLARKAVARTTWYFNDQEVTSSELEKQSPEAYTAWFTGAKKEWSNFDTNKAGTFKAPDQSRNAVLEKNFKSEETSRNFFGYIVYFMPVILIMTLLYILFSRQMKGGTQGAMNFGKSTAKLLVRDNQTATFKDVAGCPEAIDELKEVVDFLKDPARFARLGARIPKGALLIGSPGTGKTLLARAVAGEANVPFFTTSGSEFVEMFVGVGAKRVRDMFEQARASSPCIIFIDEIDAVGRQRGVGMSGGHDEREQTLNQLLVEMDGFGVNDSVILIAATNRPDVLDKALLRPGRFDRQVVVELPDIAGRYQILLVHAKKFKLEATVDFMAIAKSTPGASGADLYNIINEAALFAAREGQVAITDPNLTCARDKVLYGKERRSLEIDEAEKKATAYHESGHAIVALNVKNSDSVNKVTIIPRGMSLGATHFAPKKNRVSYSKAEAMDQIAILLGGRAAEEIFLGSQLSGCQQDFDQATKLARAMICQWGMSDLGQVAYDERNAGGQYLGGASVHEKSYSEKTAQDIDARVKEFVNTGYELAKKVLTEQSKKVILMTDMLMKFETLEAADVLAIQDGSFSETEMDKKLKNESDKKFQVASPPAAPLSPPEFA